MIAGNHELSFDPVTANDNSALSQARSGHIGGHSPLCDNVDIQQQLQDIKLSPEDANKTKPSSSEIKKELSSCIYLEDSSVEICGLKIYGEYELMRLLQRKLSSSSC